MTVSDDLQTQFLTDFQNLLAERRNEVSFLDRDVSSEKIDDMLADANMAPSVGLSQPWRFVEVRSPERRKAVYKNFLHARQLEIGTIDADRQARYSKLGLTGLDSAPVHVAFFLDNSEQRGHGLGVSQNPLALNYSVALAAYTFWLATYAHGLASGWVSILEPDAVTNALDVPPEWELVAYMCVGYSATPMEGPDLEKRKWSRRQTLDPYLLKR